MFPSDSLFNMFLSCLATGRASLILGNVTQWAVFPCWQMRSHFGKTLGKSRVGFRGTGTYPQRVFRRQLGSLQLRASDEIEVTTRGRWWKECEHVYSRVVVSVVVVVSVSVVVDGVLL